MSDCPNHPDADHRCIMDGPHIKHGAWVDGKWVFWDSPPDPRRMRRRPSTTALIETANALEGRLDTPIERMSTTDGPDTSKAAAKKVRTGSQKHRLLVAYAAHPDGLTDEEAAEITGMLGQHGVCWWARSCDLRDEGRIADTGQTRPSPRTNEERMVCSITDLGREALFS